MLHILWIILKIILMIIGILLAVVLGVLLLILFCPVRYEAAVAKPQAEKILDAQVQAKVSWLFRAISVRVSCIKRKPEFGIYLFGKSLDSLFGKKKPDSEKTGAAKEKGKKKDEPGADAAPPADEKEKAKVLEAEELRKESEKESAMPESSPKEQEDSAVQEKEPAAADEIKEEKPEESEKIEEESAEGEETPTAVEDKDKEPEKAAPKKSFFEKLEEKTGALGRKIHDSFEKLQKLMEKAEWWKDFITDERTGFAISCVLGQLGKIIKHILPKKFWGHITYGFEDPSITGRILALAGMTLPLHKNAVEIDPRFDEEFILDADVGLKGRLYGIRLAASAVMILINKDVWFVIKTLMHREG